MKSTALCLVLLLLCPSIQAQEGESGRSRDGVVEMTDAAGEAEFKKLHELKRGAKPALSGEMIDIPGGGKGYLCMPKGAKAPLPAVLVIHEWWGLNDHVKHWADRLAGEGYAALAVDMYGGKVAEQSGRALELMKAANADMQSQEKLMAAGLAFLRNDARIKAKKTATIGWCFGGGRSLQAALMDEKLDAAVIYYGRLVTKAEQLKKIKAKLLGIFAVKDRGIPISAVADFERGLLDAGVHHELHRYDANHAFANPSSGRYDERCAGDAWKKVRAFLKRELGD